MYGRGAATHSCKNKKNYLLKIRVKQHDNLPPRTPSTIGPTIKNQYPPGMYLGKRATMIKLKSVRSSPMIDIPMTLVRPCRSEYCVKPKVSQIVWLNILRLTAPHQPVVIQLRIPMDIVMTKVKWGSVINLKESLMIQHKEEMGDSSTPWCLATILKEHVHVEVQKENQLDTHELSALQQQLARLDLRHNVAFLLEGCPYR